MRPVGVLSRNSYRHLLETPGITGSKEPVFPRGPADRATTAVGGIAVTACARWGATATCERPPDGGNDVTFALPSVVAGVSRSRLRRGRWGIDVRFAPAHKGGCLLAISTVQRKPRIPIGKRNLVSPGTGNLNPIRVGESVTTKLPAAKTVATNLHMWLSKNGCDQ
jgi:hypothetical protein